MEPARTLKVRDRTNAEATWLIAGLNRRRAARLRHWPANLVQSLRRGGRASPPRMPFWLIVPARVSEAYRRQGTGGASASFLADILWGQYCLFQCIRLQDDVFDAHTKDVALVYAANLFLIEAERAFAKHFPRSSRFWSVFWAALETTTKAIVRVDELQERAGCDPATLAREYAKVGAVLKVATTAVCIKHRRPRHVAALDRFADESAMADQILDDLEDVENDLRRRRFNYVAQRICVGRTGARSSDPEQARREIAHALAVGDGARRILGDARRHLARAATTADGLRLPAVSALAADARHALDALEMAFHRAQVKRVLGPIFEGTKRERNGPDA